MRERTEFIRQKLERHGFVIGDRDRNLNSAFSGRYMVAEAYEPGTRTRDAGDGPWCIVGDDLALLIDEAGSFWVDQLDEDCEHAGREN